MEHLVDVQFASYVYLMLTSAGAFWLTYGATLQPFYYAYGNYSPDPGNEAAGLAQPAFNAAFGVYGPSFDDVRYTDMPIPNRILPCFHGSCLCHLRNLCS